MQVSVTGKRIDVGAALREYATTQLGDVAAKYFDHPIEASGVFSREGHLWRADLTVHAKRGLLVRGHAAAETPHLACDQAVERIAKRLRRNKRRLRDHRHKKPDKDIEKLFAQQYILAGSPEDEDIGPADDQAGSANPVVIAETTTEIATLTVGEAVMRLDLADLRVLVFRNGAHGRVNVIYRRADGNLGWIDPEAGSPR